MFPAGFEASEAYDAKIFAVVTLISSHLVFNSVKIITQDQVDYLELLARRAQLFSLTSYISTQLSPSTVPPSSAAAAAAASTEAGERETSSARTKEEGLGDQDQINSLGANMEAGSGGSDAVDSVEMLWTEQQAVIPPLTWVVQDFFQVHACNHNITACVYIVQPYSVRQFGE